MQPQISVRRGGEIIKVGTYTHAIKKEKEMAIAQGILQKLATENLTIGQVKTILELTQCLVSDAKFSGLAPQNVDESLPASGEDTSHSEQ